MIVRTRLRLGLAAAAVATVAAGFVTGLGPASDRPAGAQFDPTTTAEEPPTTTPTTRPPTTRPPTTRPPTTEPPPSTTAAPPPTTAPPRATTTTTTARTTTSKAPKPIPSDPLTPSVTAPPTPGPEPGAGSMAWWVVALSPLGLAVAGGVLAYNWFRTRPG